jgi:hypothetical protein
MKYSKRIDGILRKHKRATIYGELCGGTAEYPLFRLYRQSPRWGWDSEPPEVVAEVMTAAKELDLLEPDWEQKWLEWNRKNPEDSVPLPVI